MKIKITTLDRSTPPHYYYKALQNAVNVATLQIKKNQQNPSNSPQKSHFLAMMARANEAIKKALEAQQVELITNGARLTNCKFCGSLINKKNRLFSCGYVCPKCEMERL